MIAEDLSQAETLYASIDFSFVAQRKQKGKDMEESKAGASSLPGIEESKLDTPITLSKEEELIKKLGPFKSQINIKTE